MNKFSDDAIIAFKRIDAYDISYPIILKRWEIRRVKGIGKQYLNVFFQKIEDGIAEFNLKIICFSSIGETVDEIFLSVKNVEDKSDFFSHMIALKSDVSAIEIYFDECVFVDGETRYPDYSELVKIEKLKAAKARKRKKMLNAFYIAGLCILTPVLVVCLAYTVAIICGLLL